MKTRALASYRDRCLGETLASSDVPAVFTPDNEPYLGREALHAFDREIPFSLWISSHIAAYTRTHRGELSDLQRAACQIVPQGINLALSVRELIRQGYLFAALVLIRPLIERAAIISYIFDHPEAIETWKDGWRFRDRPPLSRMLHSMAAGRAELEDAKDICEHYGHIVHGDPVSANWNRVPLDDGSLGYPWARFSIPRHCATNFHFRVGLICAL